MKRKNLLLNLLIAAFLLGGLCCLGFLAKICSGYRVGQAEYKEIRAVAYGNLPDEKTASQSQITQIEKTEKEQEPGIDSARLLELNSEFKFWLVVPGTGIDYPVVQHADNFYYLDHTFKKQENASGSLFADCSAIPLAADNTIIYGHNMKNGGMFADLKKYTDQEFYKKNPIIKIFFDGKWIECPIFSCQLRSENDASAYKFNLMEDEWNLYLEKMQSDSLYPTDKSLKNGKIITLSTCYGSTQRLIVQAFLTEEKT
ncbi:MAG: class B sortase [Clostridium sp.]|nr:class B sortase [Clostridium sp.]